MMISLASIAAIASIAPLVLAVPHLYTRETDRAVTIEIQYITATSETDIRVSDDQTSKVLGYSCSSTLSSGAWANYAISADVDSKGAGNITIGPTTYVVHEDPAYSGGIRCAKIHNDAESYVTCSASIPASVPDVDLDASNILACFAGIDPSLRRVHQSIQNGNEATLSARHSEGDLTRRIGDGDPSRPCDSYFEATIRIGDGDPHQNYFDAQLSENMSCGSAATCSVGESNSKSRTVGWSASASAAGWISAGFDVSTTWTTGATYSCGGLPGETICVWYNTAHTAYTVANQQYNACQTLDPGPSFVMYSPNTANSGGGYYCVVGACRSQGSAYWDYSGRAGGP